MSPANASMAVTITPLIFDSFTFYDTFATKFSFDLDVLNSTSYIWNSFLNQRVFMAGREYITVIGLEDEEGNTNTYYLEVSVIDSSPVAFTTEIVTEEIDPYVRNEKFWGEIVELTETGLMTIKFSMPLFPVMDMSWVN